MIIPRIWIASEQLWISERTTYVFHQFPKLAVVLVSCSLQIPGISLHGWSQEVVANV